MKQILTWQRIMMSVLLSVIIGGSGLFVYQLHGRQKQLENVLPALYAQCADRCADRSGMPQAEVLEKVVHRGSAWGGLQSQIKDAIVQVFAQVAEFNWLQPYQTPVQKMGAGTGFFIDEFGHLITNAHVVVQAVAVVIQIPSLGREQFEVDVVSICFDRDIALLKLKDADLERIQQLLGKINFLKIGDSDKIYRADEIMYQGFPLGQQGLKSTVGVVSGRENVGGRQYIQIDAASNPGCSGGPGLNLKGEVVGVLNSGIPSAQNVGYLIPSKELKVVLNDLYHTHNPVVRRPFLGIAYSSGSTQLAKFLGNPVDWGVYVVAAYKDGVLYNAGIKAGDMICEINGHKIDFYGDIHVPWAEDKISLTEYTSYISIDQNINLVVYRSGQRLTFDFKFEQAKLQKVRFMYPDFEKIDYEVIGGFVVMELTLNHVLLMSSVDELVPYKKPKNQVGSKLLITHIFPASLAQRARVFEPGNIIKSVNEERVSTLADLRKALYKSIDSGNLTVRTKQGVFAVFPIQRILQQENQLSMIYHYPVSETVLNLIHALEKQKGPEALKVVDEPETKEGLVV